MKTIVRWQFFVLALLLGACSSPSPEQVSESVGGYLDSAYVSKGYRAAMDSIHESSGISDPDFKLLQGYMREFRDSLQGHPTYRELLERATGLHAMRDGGIGMRVKSMSLIHAQKLVEIRIVMSFTNETKVALGGFRGEVFWKDESGSRVSASPSFSVVGPLATGDSLTDLRLEYTMYKPTGNELNDPRNQGLRDTLVSVEAIAKRKDLKAIGFKLHDIRLANGLAPGQYWLKSEEERKQVDQQAAGLPKPIQLLKWADLHEDWVQKLAAHNSEYGLLISPVLTNRGEVSNGKRLILDRNKKVEDFFNVQKHVNHSNINQSIAGKHLVLTEYVDFWNWPMELRIYRQ